MLIFIFKNTKEHQKNKRNEFTLSCFLDLENNQRLERQVAYQKKKNDKLDQ
jgi:hypothetical protein